MNDIIHVLPDSVANQIAAGEVIQRPASVVKELVENAIDAGAQHIQVIIKDAGRTSIQVIDDGKGMSETDARLAFERHATSKIKNANDLFALHTMGFRGEALASIASVAQMELRTKRREDELGTMIQISGSRIDNQEPISCPDGCNFCVKNLFYNVPARRKFLKSNKAEFSHIEQAFLRIVLVYPNIHFELKHILTLSTRPEETVCYNLPPSTHRERIVNVFGKQINSNLFSVNADSTMVKIYGFVGKPESAKKQNDKEYFFVNNRFIKHPYFHKAVMQAYDRMLQPGFSHDYFLYFEIDPENIDVNIHPTKTEIKFENEPAIWPIVLAAVKEALGRFLAFQTIDFDQENTLDIPAFTHSKELTSTPEVKVDPSYNPFKTGSSAGSSYKRPKDDWSKLYEGFESEKGSGFPKIAEEESLEFSSRISEEEDEDVEVDTTPTIKEFSGSETDRDPCASQYFQFRNKYVLTTVHSGLMFIDQHRAHVRILYDRYVKNFNEKKGFSQKMLFPELVQLMPSEALFMEDIMDDLYYLGFEISNMGNNTFAVNGVPAINTSLNAKDFLLRMIDSVKDQNLDVKGEIGENLALSLSELAAIPYGKAMHKEELESLINDLFACPNHDFTPNNKPIISIIQDADLEKMFK